MIINSAQVLELLDVNAGYYAIVANGEFPASPAILDILSSAELIIACDGAGLRLNQHNIVSDYVVGDNDSATVNNLISKHPYVFMADQSCNDLTKAIRFLRKQNLPPRPVIIFAANGFREDHMIANFALLAQYAEYFPDIHMVSDYGIMTPLTKTITTLTTIRGQQISIFSFSPNNLISCAQLKWQLSDIQFPHLNSGTLNQATDNYITIHSQAPIIIYRSFEIKPT